MQGVKVNPRLAKNVIQVYLQGDFCLHVPKSVSTQKIARVEL